MFSYLKFWFKSSNQHGLHSPFVYNYLTKGLYEVNVLSKNKQINWIFKSIKYFKPSAIYVESDLESTLSEYKNLFTTSKLNADLLFVKNDSVKEIEQIISEMNSKQLLFVCNEMYKGTFQKKLRENKEVVLVVDFYIGTLISKRTEQLKQNFFLRL